MNSDIFLEENRSQVKSYKQLGIIKVLVIQVEEGVIGGKGEDALIYRINRDEKFRKDFAECVQKTLSVPFSGEIQARKGTRGYKTDITIIDKHSNRVGLSLKTRKPGSRPDDHLDRRWLDRDTGYSLAWTKSLSMSKEVSDAFQRGLMRKAANTSADLIRDEDQSIVESFLLSNMSRFLEEVFRKAESDLQLFGVMQYEKEKSLHVFTMDDIINFIKNNVEHSGINFTRTIGLGDFLWIQRKAGNGKHIDQRIPKTDPNHPGNQIQVKVLTIPLRNAAIKELKFCRFDMPHGIQSPKSGDIRSWMT